MLQSSRLGRTLLVHWPLAMIVVVGLVATLGTYWTVTEAGRREHETATRHAADDLAAEVEVRLDGSLSSARWLQAAFASFPEMTSEQFADYVKAEAQDNQSVRALEWIPVVPDAERDRYEVEARQRWPDFAITERTVGGELIRATRRDIYYPVYYVEPITGNEAALGFDLGSNPERLRALELARDSGEASVSAPITLVQENDRNAGVLVFAPVYESGVVPATEADRRTALRGFGLVVLYAAEVMAEVAVGAAADDLAFSLHDISTGNALFQFTSVEAPAEADAVVDAVFSRVAAQSHSVRSYEIDFGGRRWLLTVASTHASAAIISLSGWAILLAGLVLTLLGVGYMAQQRGQSGRVQRLVDIRTGELRQRTIELDAEIQQRRGAEATLRATASRLDLLLDHAVDAIVTADEHGRITSFNRAAQHMFGYTASAAEGQALSVLITPADHESLNDHLAGRAATAEVGSERMSGVGHEVTGLHIDGTTFPMHLSLSEVDTDEGRVFTGIARDISAQRAASERLAEAKDRLEGALAQVTEIETGVRSVYEIATAEGRSFEERVGRLLRLGCERFELECGVVALIADDEFEVRHIVAPPDCSIRPGDQFSLSESFNALNVASSEPVAVNDIPASEFADHPALGKFGLGAYLGISLGVAGHVAGTLSFSAASARASAFSAADLDLLQLMGAWLSAELGRQHAQAQRDEALSAKAQFLARMSHEIRTPLHGVVGNIELLRVTELQGQQRAILSTLEVSADALMSVINDALDFSKIEAGAMVLESELFDLRHLVQTVLDMISVEATKKDLELESTYPEDAPTHFIGDAARLRQVVLNLVSNAVKFTSTGSVRLTVEVAPSAPGGVASHVSIAVTDSGPGIAASEVSALFEPFTQGDTSTTRRFGGTGLGLAITHRLVQLMDGEIEVETVEGQGSTFRVKLPLVSYGFGQEDSIGVIDVTGVGGEPGADVPAMFSCAVLIADDNEVNLQIAEGMLRQLGCEVRSVTDGAAALEALRGPDDYSLVLMDVHMPRMDGMVATRAAIAALGDRCPPILAMTASTSEEDRAECTASGMVDILGKPFTFDQLKRMLERWGGGEREAVVRGAPGPNEDHPVVDLERVRMVLGLGNDGGSLFDVFRVEAAACMEFLIAAFRDSDAEKAYAAAHSLKGSAGSVGAVRLSALAAEIAAECRAGALPKSEAMGAVLREEIARFLAAADEIAA